MGPLSHRPRPEQVLRAAGHTAAFAAYCQARGVPFRHPAGSLFSPADFGRWARALASLPPGQRARVELELVQVEEMAEPGPAAHLREALPAGEQPPDDVPAGAPLVLWILLTHPALFHEVRLHHEFRAIASWRTAHAPPGLDLADPTAKAPALARELRTFFGQTEGVGRYCVVETHVAGSSTCFTAYLADRLRLIEAFTDAGAYTAHQVRPAARVTLAYDPGDGTILVQSRIRARERVLDLVRRFGRAVLGVELGEDCLAPAFNLEPLKQPFAPLPDAPDMAAVRVKAVHVRYGAGRRLVKLETRCGDAPEAVPDLLRTHLSVAGVVGQLEVCYGEILVKLREPGGERSVVIRLTPDKCNLDRSALGHRLRACLRRWGLCYA